MAAAAWMHACVSVFVWVCVRYSVLCCLIGEQAARVNSTYTLATYATNGMLLVRVSVLYMRPTAFDTWTAAWSFFCQTFVSACRFEKSAPTKCRISIYAKQEKQQKMIRHKVVTHRDGTTQSNAEKGMGLCLGQWHKGRQKRDHMRSGRNQSSFSARKGSATLPSLFLRKKPTLKNNKRWCRDQASGRISFVTAIFWFLR